MHREALTALFMKTSACDRTHKHFAVCVTHVKRPGCWYLKDLRFISRQNLTLINDVDAVIPPCLQADLLKSGVRRQR